MANTILKPNLHDRCACEIKEVGPHIGLYCKPHRHWLKWLTKDEIVVAINLGIKVANPKPRDKLSLKDNHTLDKRLKRDKRWRKYKTNKGS
jgi:hypothetical protein